jgi:uncharacterized repeat protein (TIGR02543 family)
MTLYARWAINSYLVTFDSDGGSAVTAQNVVHGSTATKPTDPTRDGFKFDGWFNGNTKWNFTMPITAPITLKAKWTEKVKLLEKTTLSGGSYDILEYDSQNRITKRSYYNSSGILQYSFTFSYTVSELTNLIFDFVVQPTLSRTEEFTKVGNKITITLTESSGIYTSTLDLNSDGLPEKYVYNGGVSYYEYQNGNIVKNIWENDEEEGREEYKYDDNKSPLYHCKTPKWFLILYYGAGGSQNNMKEVKFIAGSDTPQITTYEYEYEFDSDGYPTIRTETRSNTGTKYVTDYEYKVID